MGERRPAGAVRRALSPIVIVLCLFLVVSALWAFAVPLRDARGARSPFQPDEPNHIAVITYIAQNGSLPPYTIAYYESAHPPLYHLAAAGLYRVTQPLLGKDGGVMLLRLAGSGLGAAVVWLVWQTAVPLIGRSGALFAAALAGGIPMFVSLSASVTNETLAALAGAGTLAGLTAGVRRRHFTWRTLAVVAFWTAIGAGTKVTCLGLLPVSLGVVWAVGSVSGLPGRRIAAHLGLILLLTATLSGWWYARNAVVYGDPLRRNEATAMWRHRIPGYAALSDQGKTTMPRYTARVTFWGWASFWGILDAARRPLPTGIYACLAAFQTASFCGLVKLLCIAGMRKNALWPLIAVAAPFAAFVAMVYYRYTWDHFTPQGRFFFPLLLPFAILTASGWLLFGSRREEPRNETTPLPKAAIAVLFLLMLLNGFVLVRTLMERG